MGKWWKNKKIADKLELTTAQVNTIEQIFNLHKTKLNETKQSIIQKQNELNRKLKDSKTNKNEITQLADQVDLLNLQLRKINRNMRLEIREVLTPEQREMLYDEWSNRKHR